MPPTSYVPPVTSAALLHEVSVTLYRHSPAMPPTLLCPHTLPLHVQLLMAALYIILPAMPPTDPLPLTFTCKTDRFSTVPPRIMPNKAWLSTPGRRMVRCSIV